MSWTFDVVFSHNITGDELITGQVVLAGITVFSTDASYMDTRRNPEASERQVMEAFAEKLKAVLVAEEGRRKMMDSSYWQPSSGSPGL